MLAAYTVAAYAVYRTAVQRPPWPALLGRALLAAAIAGGIAAAQLLPTLAFAAESTRAHLSFAEAGGGYDAHDFLELLFPGGIFQRTYYIGILPLALAGLAATRRPGRFWLGLFLVAAIVALGANTPLFRLLYLAGPGFAAFRDQERAAAVAAFACCALAAQGAGMLVERAGKGPLSGFRAPFRRSLHQERAREPGGRWPESAGATADRLRPPGEEPRLAPFGFGRRLGAPAHSDGLAGNAIRAGALAVIIVLPALCAAVLLWPQGSTPGGSVQAMPRQLNVLTAGLLAVSAGAILTLGCRRRFTARVLGALILLVSATNLLAAGANLNRADSMPGVPANLAATLRWIAAQPGPFRVGNSSDNAVTNNLGTEFQVSGAFGDSPIETRRVANLIAGAGGYRVWQLFNVKYVVTRRPPGAGFTAVHREGDLITYAMQYGLPPAWAVRDVRPATSAQQALQLTTGLQQPGSTVVLEGAPNLIVGGTGTALSQQETWQRTAPGDLALTATTSNNAILVVSEPYVRGWTATLDGRPTPLYPADAALIALALPAGTHSIALQYHQPGLEAGLILAAFALLLALATFAWQRLGPRRRDCC
jgi:hypothetical protein